MEKEIQNWKIMKWLSTIVYLILCGSLSCIICFQIRKIAEIKGYWIWVGVGIGLLVISLITSSYYTYKLSGVKANEPEQ